MKHRAFNSVILAAAISLLLAAPIPAGVLKSLFGGSAAESNLACATQTVRSLNSAWQMMIAKSKMPGEATLAKTVATGKNFKSACKAMVDAGIIDQTPKPPKGYAYTTTGAGENLKFNFTGPKGKKEKTSPAVAARKAAATARSLNSAWQMYVAKSKMPNSGITVTGKDYAGAVAELIAAGLIGQAPVAPKGYAYTTTGTGDTLRFITKKTAPATASQPATRPASQPAKLTREAVILKFTPAAYTPDAKALNAIAEFPFYFKGKTYATLEDYIKAAAPRPGHPARKIPNLTIGSQKVINKQPPNLPPLLKGTHMIEVRFSENGNVRAPCYFFFDPKTNKIRGFAG